MCYFDDISIRLCTYFSNIETQLEAIILDGRMVVIPIAGPILVGRST